MRNKTRITAILLMVCLLLVTGCSTTTEPPAATQPPAETAPAPVPAPEPAPEEGKLQAGVYDIEVFGMKKMVVEVTLTDNEIAGVEIKEHHETPGIGDIALELMPKKIVEYNSVSVDAISGATITSGAIRRAVSNAIEQAGGSASDFNQKENSTYSNVFHLTNDPIPEKWDETYDVVIIGSGFAGLAAAHTAAGLGAKTIVFEKMPVIGGNSKTNGGQYAAYTSKRSEEIHALQGTTPDTAQKHFEDTLVGGDNKGDPALIWNLVYGSPEYLNLLLDNGLVITEKIIMPGGHYGYRTYVTENQIGYDIVKIQEKIVKNSGAILSVNSLVTQVYRETTGDKKVVGVRVETPDGVKNVAATNGVVMAAGGFGANIEMRQKYNDQAAPETKWPTLDSSVPTTNHPGATGDGIIMGEAIGAQTTQMDYIQLYPFADPKTGVLDSQAVIPFSLPSYGGVYVDINGKRYVNEGERRDVCATAAQNSAGFPTFAIYDSVVSDKLVLPAIKEAGLENGRIIEAATLEELAAKINEVDFRGNKAKIDGKTLAETVAKFNGYLKSGTDEEFGRVLKDTMLPIENGPFYAVPTWPSVHHTMGGLKINSSTQVLDVDGNIIPNLFAAGEVTGEVHGTNRLGSNADADTVAHGWIAGQIAANGTLPDFTKQIKK